MSILSETLAPPMIAVNGFSDRCNTFSALTNEQQIQLLTAIETTPFFKTVRDHTIMGMFSDPKHAGNYQKVGWKLIAFDDSLNFKAPFGAYDA